MRGIRPNWLLGYLIPTIYILGGGRSDAKNSDIAVGTQKIAHKLPFFKIPVNRQGGTGR